MEKSEYDDKLVVSVGAGYPQYPFIYALKEKGYQVAAFGKGRNDENAVKLCDYFKEIDTGNHIEAIDWLKQLPIEVSAVGSFAGGIAINTLHEISRAFNLPTSIPKPLSVGMDKFSQQKLYEKYNLNSIKTFRVSEFIKTPLLANGIDEFIIKPSIGRGSAGVCKVTLKELKKLIFEKAISETDMIQEFRSGEEYRMLIIVQDNELKLLAPIKRQSFHGSFLLGRLSYVDDHLIKIKDYVIKMIDNLKLKDVIIKADILVSEENIDMIEMDIGVGGGVYYKTFISYLFNYNITDEYINLITGNEVAQAKTSEHKVLMDYVYNLSGKPITYDKLNCNQLLNNILGENIIVPNLLCPGKTGNFKSNADFIFCVIHQKSKLTNLEINDFVNKKIFKR